MKPHLVVFSTLFPHAGAPNAGAFIRERMFRVGEQLPVTVVSPQAWFPGQSLIRRWKPHFRPAAPRRESHQGIDVLHPRFFSVPGLFKQFDGLLMALSCYVTLKRLQRMGKLDILDAHFGYPDGYAATLLGRWLRVPVTITLRGTEVPHARNPALRPRLVSALQATTRVFSVSESLRQHAISLGIAADKIRVVGNGVDIAKFHPVDRAQARAQLGIAADVPVLISVGGLVERKGFHRVIACLPELIARYRELQLLIVGGASAEGDMRAVLERQVAELGMQAHVRFLGILPAASLKWPLSAADVFVLSTRNEGWANVFLEAMACGLPVISTDVGGNAEVVCRVELGSIVPFDEHEALRDALMAALARDWDREAILAYARDNDWHKRVAVLVEEFNAIHARRCSEKTVVPVVENGGRFD
ncbi:glycosyltransferase [Sulfuriferula sp.]|uniref:glycosyltransferase n=1 Tax=Sulfuriferula sp. TaxID=2025307 RepID=UPI0027317143|nr:glycosyltransferase [Sulfuriferula sp.]MDP2025307.1 glycosyltransferase [Sulfuriferula sp.]